MHNPIYCNRCGLQSSADAQFCQSCGDTLRTPLPAPLLSPQNVPDRSVSAVAQLTPSVRYAGFWIRVVASLMDFILIFIVLFPMRLLIGSTTTILGEDWQLATTKILFMNRMARIGMGILLAWLYRAGMESSHFQGTLGKLAVQIKVTDLEGNRISFERATGRYLAKFLSLISLGVGYLMVGFTLEKQGLHDRLAGTRVLYR